MPRYFFDIEDAAGIERDDTGLDLRHIEAAKAEAIKTLRNMIADNAKEHIGGSFHLAIRIREDDEPAYRVKVTVEINR